MNRLLTAVLAAGVLLAPAAFAQEAPTPAGAAATADTPAAPAGEAPTGAPNEPAASTMVAPGPGAAPDTGTGGTAPGQIEVEGEHATPHYPLEHPHEMDWTFAGPFGHWDIAQLQRGLKIYKEVCSACHSMNLVAFRDLGELGYNIDQVKAFAAEYTVPDPNPNSSGEIVERPGIPSDYFPSPYPNHEAAAAANNGAAPPDLSLMAKARAVERGFPRFVWDILPWSQYAEGGPDYIHSLLTGYGEEPKPGIVIQDGTYYNPHFIAGPALAMPPPLSDDQVTYDDGTPQTLDQYARDISAFLMWTAEPHLVARKQTGLVVLLFLIVFSGLLFLVKRRVWASTPH
jgi:ubiquinol-cytochrome c reductase cytochrome c1 subunit